MYYVIELKDGGWMRVRASSPDEVFDYANANFADKWKHIEYEGQTNPDQEQ